MYLAPGTVPIGFGWKIRPGGVVIAGYSHAIENQKSDFVIYMAHTIYSTEMMGRLYDAKSGVHNIESNIRTLIYAQSPTNIVMRLFSQFSNCSFRLKKVPGTAVRVPRRSDVGRLIQHRRAAHLHSWRYECHTYRSRNNMAPRRGTRQYYE